MATKETNQVAHRAGVAGAPRRLRRFWLLAGAVLVALGVSGFVVFDLHHSQQIARRSYTDSVSGLELIGELQYQAQEARRTLLYALATTDSNRQVDYADQSRAADKQVAQLQKAYRALGDSPPEIEAARQLAGDWQAYLLVRDELIASMLEGNPKQAIERDLRDGVPAFNRVRDDLQSIQRLCKAQAGRLLGQANTSFQNSLLRLIVMVGLSLILAFVAAVTIQKTTRLRAVQASEARLRQDLESINEELTLLDGQGRVLLWNSAAETAWRRPRAGVIGRPLLEAFPEIASTPLPAAITTALQTGSASLHADLHLSGPDGERFYEARVFSFQGGVSVFLHDITVRKHAEAESVELNQRLIETSRHAGMAEVATGVLHNVGNVLNSVNVSANLMVEQIRKSKTTSLAKAVQLLSAHKDDAGQFLTHDPKGKQLPAFLEAVSEHLTREQAALGKEMQGLQTNIEHIKQIVAMQQSYAKVSGALENLAPHELVEDALRMSSSALARHSIEIVREFDPVPPVLVDRHTVLQILVNLVSNARQALDTRPEGRRLTLRVVRGAGDCVRVEVSDNGMGIAPENFTRLFQHGFTTKKDGHGFGLHSAANAAKEMGGSLTVASAGAGHGATFTLELRLAGGKQLAQAA